MSFPTRATCPHGRGVFAYLADGPQRGDENDPNWGRYPFVHNTSVPGEHGALEVCDLMPFALPVDVGEMCACGHSSDMHGAGDAPIPAGMLAKPRACHCGCPDFRHRREDLERWRREPGSQRADKPAEAAASPVAVEEPPGEPEQLALFGEPAPVGGCGPKRRRREQTLAVAGEML